MKIPSMVRVKWVDSTSVHGWEGLDKISGTPLVCVSVGLLVRDMSDRIVLSLAVAEVDEGGEPQYLDSLVIPRRAVIEMTGLREVLP